MTKIDLEFPVTNGSETVKSITLRRAKVKDIEKIQSAVEAGGEIAGSIVSVSCLSGLPEDVVREIDGADYVRIAEAISGFLPGAKTGASGAESSQTLPTS